MRSTRWFTAALLAVTLVGACVLIVRPLSSAGKTHIVAYFDNSNGIFVGDGVVILGVRVGEINKIEPQPERAKISLSIDDTYKIPADARAVILSPQLITARAIQLTPAYTGGPVLGDNSVILQERTAVPVEWDDLREQLEKLADSLQPTEPGGVSPLGAIINTTADNLRGEGANVRDAIIKLSQVFSALGDHSGDIFATTRNISTLVTALQSSADAMADLNRNFAAVTALMANDPDEVARALSDVNVAARDVQSFIEENREPIGTATDKLASVSTALAGSIDDIKQTLHVVPNALQNYLNIYEPAHGSISGVLAVNNFANPIQFLCGAIQAASRVGSEQAAKLCVQYLAPIVKNRQYNFPPIGTTISPIFQFPVVNAQVRPNEVTYSEDWMRPDFRPEPQPAAAAAPAEPPPIGVSPDGEAAARLPAEAVPTNPADGLPGLMVPSGAGS